MPYLHTLQRRAIAILSLSVFAVGFVSSAGAWQALIIPVSTDMVVVNILSDDCDTLLASEESLLDSIEALYDTAERLEERLEKTKSTASQKNLEKQLGQVDTLILQGEASLQTVGDKIDRSCLTVEEE